MGWGGVRLDSEQLYGTSDRGFAPLVKRLRRGHPQHFVFAEKPFHCFVIDNAMIREQRKRATEAGERFTILDEQRGDAKRTFVLHRKEIMIFEKSVESARGHSKLLRRIGEGEPISC